MDRIQRIGQIRDEVLLYNMRYRDSVENRVHELLSERLEDIFELFGQVPRTYWNMLGRILHSVMNRKRDVKFAVFPSFIRLMNAIVRLPILIGIVVVRYWMLGIRASCWLAGGDFNVLPIFPPCVQLCSRLFQRGKLNA